MDCNLDRIAQIQDMPARAVRRLLAARGRDFLDEMIAERTERNPDFPHLLDRCDAET